MATVWQIGPQSWQAANPDGSGSTQFDAPDAKTASTAADAYYAALVAPRVLDADPVALGNELVAAGVLTPSQLAAVFPIAPPPPGPKPTTGLAQVASA